MQGRRRALRLLVFTACLAASFSLGVRAIVRMLDAADLGSPAINFNIVDILQRRLPALSDSEPGTTPSPVRVVVLGDSTVVSYPRGRQVHQALERELSRLSPEESPAVEMISLAVSGVAAFDYFFLADEIAAAEPDGVLFSFNLDTLSEDWRNSYARPELVGRIAPARVPEAGALPLHWIGLTYDRFLFSVSVVQAGGYGLWYELMFQQARMGRARKAVRDWIGASVGNQANADFDRAAADALIARLFQPGGTRRFTPEGQLTHYGAALSGIPEDHPVLLALAGTLAAFERAGIPVFVYLTPANVEYMQTLGLLDGAGLDETVRQVERVVVANGGEFLDLHALLPDGAFRDATGHFTVGEAFDGPALLAEALAPAFLEHVRTRYRTGD
jgi:hypothetical protein